MGISVSEQLFDFLLACLLGVGFGVVYDCFRILRLAIPHHSVLAVVEDVLFFMIAAVLTFFFFLAHSQGQIRLYVLLGEGLGFAVYYVTVGNLVFRISRFIISLVKKILRFLYRICVAPFVKLFRFIYQKEGSLFGKIKLIYKKPKGFLKYHLHRKQGLLYNQSSYNFIQEDGLKQRRDRKRLKEKGRKKWPEKEQKEEEKISS